jgi:2-hydroxychromene-2-carboxylate isomerase
VDPLHSKAPLIVYVDIKSPYAFVAIEPTLALERRLGMVFDWRPLTLDIPSYLGSARKKAGKVVQSTRSLTQWLAVKYAYRDARRYAQWQGNQLHGTEKIWDSSIVNMGISWICQHDRERLADYFSAVYPPFWRRELDIEDAAVVARCVREAGVDDSGFEAFQRGPGRVAHDALQDTLLGAGIYGVPTYVVQGDGQPLFGREHLPWVEWALRGGEGQAPDIGVSR